MMPEPEILPPKGTIKMDNEDEVFSSMRHVQHARSRVLEVQKFVLYKKKK